MNSIIHLADKALSCSDTWDGIISNITEESAFFAKYIMKRILKSESVAFGDDVLAKLINLNIIQDEIVRFEKEKQRIILDKEYAEMKRSEREKGLIGSRPSPNESRLRSSRFDDDIYFTTTHDLPEDRYYRVSNEGKIFEILYVFIPTEENIQKREKSKYWRMICDEGKKTREEEDKKFPQGYVKYIMWESEGCEEISNVISLDDAKLMGLFNVPTNKSPFGLPNKKDDYFDDEESLYGDDDYYDNEDSSYRKNDW